MKLVSGMLEECTDLILSFAKPGCSVQYQMHWVQSFVGAGKCQSRLNANTGAEQTSRIQVPAPLFFEQVTSLEQN